MLHNTVQSAVLHNTVHSAVQHYAVQCPELPQQNNGQARVGVYWATNYRMENIQETTRTVSQRCSYLNREQTMNSTFRFSLFGRDLYKDLLSHSSGSKEPDQNALKNHAYGRQ